MVATVKPLQKLTAADLMSGPVITLHKDMLMGEAARLLTRNQVSGAPVVDAHGRCIGVVSAADFLRLAGTYSRAVAIPPTLPITCNFQGHAEDSSGNDTIACTLPEGACPYQTPQQTADGSEFLACLQPRCVCSEWQVIEVERPGTITVRTLMTADPVTVSPDTPLHVMARQMIDAHIHRLVVVDERVRPIGLVSSTDLLAALAYAGDRELAAVPSA